MACGSPTISITTATGRCLARTTARRSTPRSTPARSTSPATASTRIATVTTSAARRGQARARRRQAGAGRFVRTGTSCSSPSTRCATTTHVRRLRHRAQAPRHHAQPRRPGQALGVVHVHQRAVGRHDGVDPGDPDLEVLPPRHRARREAAARHAADPAPREHDPARDQGRKAYATGVVASHVYWNHWGSIKASTTTTTRSASTILFRVAADQVTDHALAWIRGSRASGVRGRASIRTAATSPTPTSSTTARASPTCTTPRSSGRIRSSVACFASSRACRATSTRSSC